MEYDFQIAFDCIFFIIKSCFPFAFLWSISLLVYRSILNALSGKDVNLR